MSQQKRQQGDDQVIAGIQAVATALKNNPGSIQRIEVTAGTANQRVHDLVLLARDSGIGVREERLVDDALEFNRRATVGVGRGQCAAGGAPARRAAPCVDRWRGA